MSDRTRILLVEDHQVVREGLRALLSAEPDLEVIGEANDGLEAVERATALAPELVVIDATLPRLDGIEAIRRLIRTLPDTLFVVLSMHDDAATVDRALRAGARGYVLKGAGIATLVQAIRTVRAGEVFLSPGISDYVLQGYLRADPVAHDPLSPREREILTLIAEGRTGREIAGMLGLKPKTVENHRGRMMEKLGIHTTAGLVRYALRAKIVE